MDLQTEGKNSPKRYRGRGKRWENPVSIKNQSDCWIRYRALLDKTRRDIWSYETSLFYIYIKTMNK